MDCDDAQQQASSILLLLLDDDDLGRHLNLGMVLPMVSSLMIKQSAGHRVPVLERPDFPCDNLARPPRLLKITIVFTEVRLLMLIILL